MNYGVIIVSKDRSEMIKKTIPHWVDQNLPITVLVEPDEEARYRNALEDWNVEVAPHAASDLGVGFARQSSLIWAAGKNYDAYIMADDDTVIRQGDDARKLLDFVARGQAINCGGWMSIHGFWFGKEKGELPDHVVQHYCDKVYATNVKLTLEVGGYDTTLPTHETSELNREGIKAGYIWWVHTGVHIRELFPKAAPGGISSYYAGRDDTRESSLGGVHQRIYDKWGARYVSDPSKRFRTQNGKMIRDCMGDEAYEAYRNKTPYPDQGDVPHGRI